MTACGTTVKVKGGADVGGEVVAKVVVEFPQAQECFDDDRIETYDQLRECLWLLTNYTWTVSADGEVVSMIQDLQNQIDEARDQDSNNELTFH